MVRGINPPPENPATMLNTDHSHQADISYTAFDSTFLSYHANMGRISEMYLRTGHALQFSSNFPLRPFVDNAAALFYDDPREYRYTTLGDMPKPIQAMQYIYAAPAALDFLPITQIEKKSAAVPSGGTEVFVPSSDRIARLNSTMTQDDVDQQQGTTYIVFWGYHASRKPIIPTFSSSGLHRWAPMSRGIRITLDESQGSGWEREEARRLEFAILNGAKRNPSRGSWMLRMLQKGCEAKGGSNRLLQKSERQRPT